MQRLLLPSGAVSYTVLDDQGVVRPVDEFLAALTAAARSENTVRAYAYDLLLWWRFCVSRQLDWKAAKLADAGRFVSWLERPMSGDGSIVDISAGPARQRSSIDRTLSAVFGFYTHHYLAGGVTSDAMVSLSNVRGRNAAARSAARASRRPIPATSKMSLPRTVSSEDLDAIANACTSLRDEFLIAMWSEVGMRVGQTLGLRHSDFNGRARAVSVERRSNDNGAWAKNRKPAVLPITPALVRLHHDYMFEEYGDIDSDYLFVVLSGPTRGAPLTADAVSKMVLRLRRRSGVYFTPHMLRHTFATEWLRNGGRREVLSDMLTHTNINSINVYLHLDTEDLRKELVKLPKRPGGDA